jgi:isopenicillin-N epimerase
LRQHWTLDPGITFLNHGSFGACPAAVLDEQSRLRARLESDPVRFLAREQEALLDQALEALGAFVGAAAEDLAFVPNATAGVNAVLRSLRFEPGDEILTTDHLYPACRNAIDYVAARTGARTAVAQIAFPLKDSSEIAQTILDAAGPRTRLAVLDHVTSPTALIFPVAELVRALSARGIDTLVDGAHAPGMLPLDLKALGAAYYVGNCHKWLCAPKGVGFLHARSDRQASLAPLSISHGATSARADKSRYRLLFDWTGTADPTAALCVPAALRFMASLSPQGWPGVMRANHALALQARDLLCRSLKTAPPAPGEMLGSMASVFLPEARVDLDTLWREEGIEAAVFDWADRPARLLRVSAQLYNTPADLEKLDACLRRLYCI